MVFCVTEIHFCLLLWSTWLCGFITICLFFLPLKCFGCFSFGYFEESCSEQSILWGYFYFSWANTWEWDFWVMWLVDVYLLKKAPNCFSKVISHWTFLPTVYWSFGCFKFLPALGTAKPCQHIYVVESHCGVDLHFLSDSWCWTFSLYLFVFCIGISFGEHSLPIFSLFFKWTVCILT